MTIEGESVPAAPPALPIAFGARRELVAALRSFSNPFRAGAKCGKINHNYGSAVFLADFVNIIAAQSVLDMRSKE